MVYILPYLYLLFNNAYAKNLTYSKKYAIITKTKTYIYKEVFYVKTIPCKKATEFKFTDFFKNEDTNFYKLLRVTNITPANFVQLVRKYFYIYGGPLEQPSGIEDFIEEVKDYHLYESDFSFESEKDCQEVKRIFLFIKQEGYIREDLSVGSVVMKILETIHNSDDIWWYLHSDNEKYESIKTIEETDLKKILNVLKGFLSPLQFQIFEFDLRNNRDFYRYSKVEKELLYSAYENITGSYTKPNGREAFLPYNAISEILEIVGNEYENIP